MFTGQETDEKTGLIYFGARFYDPDVGRFINQDSYLGESNTPPSLHRYLYAYSNPNVYVDLYGYEAVTWTDQNGKTRMTDDADQGYLKYRKRTGAGEKSGDADAKRNKEKNASRLSHDANQHSKCQAYNGGQDCDVFEFEDWKSLNPNAYAFTDEGNPVDGGGGACPEQLDQALCSNRKMWVALGETSEAGGALVGVLAGGVVFKNPGKVIGRGAKLTGEALDAGDNTKSISREGISSKAVNKNGGTGGGIRYVDQSSTDNMVSQELSMSCGAACARQVLLDKGIDIPESTIRELAKVSPKTGTGVDNVIDALNKLDPKTQYTGGGVGPDAFGALNKRGPWIAMVKPNTGPHFVIVDGVEDGRVMLRDPWGLDAPGAGQGLKGTVEVDDFMEYWRRTYHQAIFRE